MVNKLGLRWWHQLKLYFLESGLSLNLIFYDYEVGFHGCKNSQIAPLGVKDLSKFKKSSIIENRKSCGFGTVGLIIIIDPFLTIW